MNLLAAIALLVWGTHIVRTGVLRVYGANLRQVLRRSVGNRGTSFVAGVGVTGLLQSSTATALLASSFVSQGMITTSAALAVMLGADVGTALMVQFFSLNLAWLAPLLIVAGVVVYLSKKNERAGQIGKIVLGLGVIILALQMVTAATAPLTQASGVRVLFGQLSGDLLLDVLIGALLVVVSYSSLAVVLLVATLAATHVVPIEVALPIVLGANLGSGLLALLTTWKADAVARRVPLGNFLFKAAGVACAVAGIATRHALSVAAAGRSAAARRAISFAVQHRAGDCVHSIYRSLRARLLNAGCRRRGRPTRSASRNTWTRLRSTRPRSRSGTPHVRRFVSPTRCTKC